MTVALGEPLLVDRPTDVLAELCSSVFAQPFLRMPQLAALRVHDARRGSGYVETLAACLDTLGNVSACADRLAVHVNTYRYRLRRLVALAGLDLADADERLVCALELAAPSPSPADRDLGPVPHWPGLPADVPLAVIVFRVFDADDADVPCRLARMVAMSWHESRTSAWSDMTGRTLYSVVALGSAGSAEVVESSVRRVVREATDALGVTVVAGIGPVVPDGREAETSRWLADEVVRIVARRRDTSDSNVATLDEVRTAIVLDALEAAAADRPDIDGGVVARLAAHDVQHGTDYLATLRTYLDAFGDVTDAAASAYVHVRTFRYRLRRIEAIGRIRLDEPFARLAVALELRVDRRPRVRRRPSLATAT